MHVRQNFFGSNYRKILIIEGAMLWQIFGILASGHFEMITIFIHEYPQESVCVCPTKSHCDSRYPTFFLLTFSAQEAMLSVLFSCITSTLMPMPWLTRWIELLWNHLPLVKKLFGGWPKIGLLFICLPAAALFSSKFASFLSIQRVFELFNGQGHSFHKFLGLKHPGEQSTSIIHLHAEAKNRVVFLSNRVILIILPLKSTKFWQVGHMITW